MLLFKETKYHTGVENNRPSKAEMFGQLVRAKSISSREQVTALVWYVYEMNEGIRTSEMAAYARGGQAGYI